MPELPEVETIKRKLEPLIIGRKIIKIEILERKQFIGNPKQIIGKKVIAVLRKGKYLSLQLENDIFLNIHLKLTGQFLYAKNKDRPFFKYKIPFTGTNKMPANTTRIIFYFDNNSVLFFNDLRKFGTIKIGIIPHQPKGVDVFSPQFTLDVFKKILSQTKREIKIVIMDQAKISGIGNIYASEALFLAKINPKIRASNLDKKQIRKLHLAIKKVIEQGVKDGGSSASDEAFILLDGSKGGYQKRLLVYQKSGHPCPVCKTKIKVIRQGGRSTFLCPHCQKDITHILSPRLEKDGPLFEPGKHQK